MEKIKIEFDKYSDLFEEKEIVGADGTKIHVRTHIPYRDKIEMAKNLIENCLMVHDDSCCYEWVDINAERIKAIFQYYTDVDVDDIPAYDVADFAINNELIGQISSMIYPDINEVDDLFDIIEKSVVDTFDDDRSLGKAIRTSFGFLFNGEDITAILAKAEMMKDTMFDALKALNEKDKHESTKLHSGKLKVGNNIVNFSKKE